MRWGIGDHLFFQGFEANVLWFDGHLHLQVRYRWQLTFRASEPAPSAIPGSHAIGASASAPRLRPYSAGCGRAADSGPSRRPSCYTDGACRPPLSATYLQAEEHPQVSSIAESRLCDLSTRSLVQGFFGGENALRTPGLGDSHGASPGESGGALSELGRRGVASDSTPLRLPSQAFSAQLFDAGAFV